MLLPTALPFLLNFMGIEAQLRPQSYFNFVTGLMFWIGIAFEFPLVIYVLTAMGFIKPRVLAQQWRIAVVIIAIAFPLVWLQRRLMGASSRFVSVRGKGLAARPLPLGRWRWPAFAVAADKKIDAREGLVKIAKETNFGDTQLWTRVNSLDSPWCLDDLSQLVAEIG